MRLAKVASRPSTRARATVSAGRVRIGISGWNFKAWRGGLYPPQKREIESARCILNTIEINGSSIPCNVRVVSKDGMSKRRTISSSA